VESGARGGAAEVLVDAPYTEPWQARAVALAVETVAAAGVPWDEFRSRLVEAVDADPQRAYFESWLAALEQFVLDLGTADRDELDSRRMRAAAYRTDESAHDDLEVFPIAVSQPTLLELLTEVFENWWQQIRFGILIEGAVYELRAPHRPHLSMLDGYLTIGFDGWHVHLCIGEHRGLPDGSVPVELARRRRCAHAELQRVWTQGAPGAWMLRLYNGDGEQQLTVLLPHPFLDDEQRILDAPDHTRLELWDLLRSRYLDLPPDPVDRSAERFVHT
jgi:nitrile hydratase accessory protein